MKVITTCFIAIHYVQVQHRNFRTRKDINIFEIAQGDVAQRNLGTRGGGGTLASVETVYFLIINAICNKQ